MRKYIAKNAKTLGISGIEFEGCYYMTFKMEKDDSRLMSMLADALRNEGGINCRALVENSEIPIFDKYDNYIPADLIRKAYSADRLRADEAEKRIFELSMAEE